MTKESMARTANTRIRIFAIHARSPAKLPKPRSAATSARIRKVIAKRIIRVTPSSTGMVLSRNGGPRCGSTRPQRQSHDQPGDDAHAERGGDRLAGVVPDQILGPVITFGEPFRD